MTALEYMERQVNKHRMNFERESARGCPVEMLTNIQTYDIRECVRFSTKFGLTSVARHKHCRKERYYNDVFYPFNHNSHFLLVVKYLFKPQKYKKIL